MKVIFCIPSHSGTFESECVISLLQAQALLQKKGIPHEIDIVQGCPYLPVARNNLVARFMASKDATDLFFIDSDVGFDPFAVLKLLEYTESVVAGIYPLKHDEGGFPVRLKLNEDGCPFICDGLIEAERLPTGFMRIKREVFEVLKKSYPELRYTLSDVNVTEGVEVYDYFNMGLQESDPVKWLTEDFAFCSRWAAIGGTMWVDPNINFTHTGRKVFKGNYSEHLNKGVVNARVS